MAQRNGLDFLVDRHDWRRYRFETASVPDDLTGEQVLFRVGRFALTSNNISYALVGDAMGYWQFFPADDGWGRIPVMGFADVIRSAHPEVAEGQRVFGFFPMSTHLVVEAERVGPTGFSDGAPHRREHAPVYRQYTRVENDPLYDAAREDPIMLLRGLFMTSFLVDDFLAEHDFFGARSFVVTSASSKTSIALAFLLAKRARGKVIGLTSPRNAAFVERLGCYDRAVAYDDVAALPVEPTVMIDMAGNHEVVSALHRHFGDDLKHDCVVGATHWEAGGFAPPADLPGPSPQFFFAPTQIQKRSAEWGPAGFQERVGGAWRGFLEFSDGWLRVVRSVGPEALERIYLETLEGKTRPNEGHVLSLSAE